MSEKIVKMPGVEGALIYDEPVAVLQGAGLMSAEMFSDEVSLPSPGEKIETINISERIRELAEEYLNSNAAQELAEIDLKVGELSERRRVLKQAQLQCLMALQVAVKQANGGKLTNTSIQLGDRVIVWVMGTCHVFTPQKLDKEA